MELVNVCGNFHSLDSNLLRRWLGNLQVCKTWARKPVIRVAPKSLVTIEISMSKVLNTLGKRTDTGGH